MNDINYDYTLSEDLNLNALLIAGGYPAENIGDLTVSDFTPTGEDGYATLKVTIPNAEHPLYPMIGNKLSMVHKYVRAHFLKPESNGGTGKGMTVYTPMQAFDPLAAVRAKFNNNISANIVLAEPIVQNPAVYEYNTTLGAPASSKTFDGSEPIKIKSTIDMLKMVKEMKPTNGSLSFQEQELAVFFNPYAQVSVADNGKIASTFNSTMTAFGSPYLVGNPKGDTEYPVQNPFRVLADFYKDSSDPVLKGISNRLKALISSDVDGMIKPWETNEDPSSYQIATGAGKDDLMNIFGPSVNRTKLTNEVSKYVFSPRFMDAVPEMEAFEDGYDHQISLVVVGYKFYYAIKDLLCATRNLTVDIRKMSDASHVIEPTVSALGENWLGLSGTFDDATNKVTFDTSNTGVSFATKEEFAAACVASVTEMLTSGDYIPTITLTDNQQAGSAFTASIKVTSVNANPSPTSRWEIGFGGKTVSFMDFEWVGALTPAETINEILPGFNKPVEG